STLSSIDRNPRRITRSGPSRPAKKTASTTSHSPSPTRPWHAPTRWPGGSASSGGIWPWRERLARGSRTRRTATCCSKTSSRFDPVCVVEFEFLTPFRHESPRVAAPERREDAEPDLLGDPIHPGMLIVRRDGPDDHAFHVNPVEDPSQRVELALLPRRGGLADQGDSHRLRLERGEVQVRRVEEHRVAVLRRDREEMRHVPTPLRRDVGRIGRVLATGEQAGHAHASRRAMEGKRLREPMLTLFE